MFKGMEYIYAVYKEQSFSKAAKSLFISQPSLSAAVKKVEKQIGSDIFDRSTSPISLTECGKRYIDTMEKMMDLTADFENYKNDLADLKAGSIVLGGTNLFTSFILPPILTSFSQKYPHIGMNLVETHTSMLEKQLNEGALDLVIDNYQFDPAIYNSQLFCKEKLVLAVPRSYSSNEKLKIFQMSAADICFDKHRCEDQLSVPLDSFAKDPFLFLKEGNDTRIRADRICKHSNFQPMVTLMLDQQITAYNLTCYGMGISFISDTLIKNVKPDPNVIFYKLNNHDATREVRFFYKKGRYMKSAVYAFLNLIKIKEEPLFDNIKK